MMKKPNYCKGVAIVHGKSELLLVEHIKSNLHLPIEIYAQSSGKTSIQIDGLMNILGNNIFKNKRVFSKKYIVEEEKGKFNKWYCGHYHENKQVNNEFVLLYEDIVPLEYKSIFE